SMMRNRSPNGESWGSGNSSASPCSRTRTSGCLCRNAATAGTVTAGPPSPPIASTAMIKETAQRPGVRGAGGEDSVVVDRDHLAAAIEAITSHVVATVGFATEAVHGQRRPRKGIVRTAHAASGASLAILLYGHVISRATAHHSR